MQKILTTALALALVIFVMSCDGTSNAAPENTEQLGNFLTEKISEYVELTEEQKTKVVALTQASGIMADGVRSSEDKAKFKALRQQIYNEVLTPEQQAKVELK